MLTFNKVTTQEELLDVYKLRFKVYCQERGFEPETAYPDERMQDEYDSFSMHFIAKKGNETVGTSRVILNNPIGFPIEKYCSLDTAGLGLKKEQTVEVSRLAVSKEMSRHNGHGRQGIILGLIREMVVETRKSGIIYYYAAMAGSLQKLLRRCGISFFQAGPECDYHGLRSPYISSLPHVERGLMMNNMSVGSLEFMPENGNHIIRQLPNSISYSCVS